MQDPKNPTPLFLSEPCWRSRLHSSLRQAGEALAVIGSIVAVGLVVVAL